MEQLIKDTIDYLTEVTGLRLDAQAIQPRNMPVFITEQYAFYTLRLGNEKFLGVVLRKPVDFQVSVLEKHRKHFPAMDKGFVLIGNRLEGYVRKRLIEMRIPFIVPKVQLYWPELGLEYRKRNRERIVEDREQGFLPSTQAVLIGILNNVLLPPFRPKELAEKLGYSLMTMTRALDQMEAAGLGESIKNGRDRFFTPLEKHRLWEKAAPLLISPVRTTAHLREIDVPDEIRLLAGESALEKISALVAPQTNIYAAGGKWGKLLPKKIIPHLRFAEPGTCTIQIWRYDPALFAKDGMVDVFSLYLSLKDAADERVGMAMEQALKENL